MRHLCSLAFAALALLGPPVAAASDAAASPPAVRALLFYAPECTECEAVFEYLVPALHERYGARLEMAAVDVGDPAGEALYRAAGVYGLPAEWQGQPVAVAGENALVGLDAIAATLGDGFGALAASPGAARWPELPGLKALLAEGTRTVQGRLAAAPRAALAEPAGASEPSPHDRIANGVAVLVLAGMVLALLHSIARVRRVTVPSGSGAWLMPAAVIVGVGISAYTGYTSLAGVAPVCGPLGGCAAVQDSEYSRLFGIPMGILGVLGYSAVLVAWLIGRRLSPEGGGWRWLPWLIALGGVLFSIRLTALEPFVIGHTCIWCLGSAIAMTSILWLLSGETRRPADDRAALETSATGGG
jgi:uncharacterized membrane protein